MVKHAPRPGVGKGARERARAKANPQPEPQQPGSDGPNLTPLALGIVYAVVVAAVIIGGLHK